MTQAKVEKTMNVMPSLIDLSFQSPVMTQENRLDENLDLHFEETWNVKEMRDVEEAWDPASLLNLQLFLDAEDMYDVLDILESLELGEIVEISAACIVMGVSIARSAIQIDSKWTVVVRDAMSINDSNGKDESQKRSN
eukprot:scaffold1315_cov217-Chaetoceros_neogracile.AAC.2